MQQLLEYQRYREADSGADCKQGADVEFVPAGMEDKQDADKADHHTEQKPA